MGVDLRLLFPIGPTSTACHDMIGLSKDYELWEAINALPQMEIREPIWGFLATGKDGDSCYGEMEKDPYGNRLKTIMSSDLLSLINHPSVTDGWKTKAAWAYIAQLPLDWPIVLYWH